MSETQKNTLRNAGSIPYIDGEDVDGIDAVDEEGERSEMEQNGTDEVTEKSVKMDEKCETTAGIGINWKGGFITSTINKEIWAIRAPYNPCYCGGLAHMDYKKASAGGNTEETKTRTNFKIPYDKVTQIWKI